MTQPGADELRKQVRQLLALAAEIPDQAERRRLTSRAFSLAQRAEAIQRDCGQATNAALDQNFKIVTASNILRFVGQLYIEPDRKMRKLYKDIAIREERWYGVRQERLKILMRLLQDCDGRIAQTAQRASAVPSDGAERLMDNLLDAQEFLLKSFCDELTAQI